MDKSELTLPDFDVDEWLRHPGDVSLRHIRLLPQSTRIVALRHPLLQGLLVTSAGCVTRARGHVIERPRGAPTFHLFACLRGTGWIKVGDGATQVIRTGDLIWIDAHEPHSYGSDDRDPWTPMWAHFTGTEASHWRAQLGWMSRRSPCVGHLPPDRLGELGLDDVYKAMASGSATHQMIEAAVALRRVFCIAARLGWATGQSCSAMDRVTAIRDRVHQSLEKHYDLETLAAEAGMSVQYFSRVFRRLTGHAPIEYLIRQRIQRACELLDTTNLHIAAIANTVGYEDSLYFTRRFRDLMGCSPRAYRKLPKG